MGTFFSKILYNIKIDYKKEIFFVHMTFGVVKYT